MCLLGDKQLIKTAIVSNRRGLYFVTILTKNFHSGVKGSQDRCQNKYNQIWVKQPLFSVEYNNDRKREYVCAMSRPIFARPARTVVNHPPWVPETFLARFPVSASPLVASAYCRSCRVSANTENSHRTRKRPLVPRILITMIQIL